MNATWLLGIVLSAICAASALGQVPQRADQQFQNAQADCRKTFEEITRSDSVWVSEELCELGVGEAGAITFGVTKAGTSLFLQSDLSSYAALYAHSGFFLQPTTDPKTYRLGAQMEGQQEFVYLHEDLGGVFSYAHFVDDRAIWIRCNQTRPVCVYYDDFPEATPVTDRWDRQIICKLRWAVSFPSPSADGQIASYMDTILPFIREFATDNADDLILGCLRPSQRISAG